MRTYMAIIAAITMLATTAALGQGGAAAPTGVDKITAYGYPAANEVQIAWATQNRTDLKTVNSLQTSATVSAPVVLIDSRGGSGMHRGGGSFRGGSSHGKSFHSQPFMADRPMVSRSMAASTGILAPIGRHDFHHRNNDFNLHSASAIILTAMATPPTGTTIPLGPIPTGTIPMGPIPTGPTPMVLFLRSSPMGPIPTGLTRMGTLRNPVYSYPYFSFSW